MSTQPEFIGIHFWVEDMAAALAFYREIGLSIPPGAEDDMFARVELGDGRTFEFGNHDLTSRYDPGFTPTRGAASCLQFRLPTREAVDELHARLVALGYRSHLDPFDAYWGARYCEICDPSGNVVGFHSPRDPSRGGPVPPRRE
jgi:uncharacterized glyoxalase superfamily protein PhnB